MNKNIKYIHKAGKQEEKVTQRKIIQKILHIGAAVAQGVTRLFGDPEVGSSILIQVLVLIERNFKPSAELDHQQEADTSSDLYISYRSQHQQWKHQQEPQLTD